ncbi:MAG: undecaprenyl/decaprenyl-phosphate alpha-N-acetylglucosaminyl 1-phosphate transferase [Clostridia bacterium]|nr:undecaprenyl/decaprenyl-phosphate alpha-N-acetylglucosaminyl 1-phosphate transferase [Oscillospiraceae bacterium]MBQ7032186.1 undecaprenyl/decaprenyl-phosphate alpha-N-acetylglucosaminyl 1-phosphate transferase [Clostridia bacterium]
MDKIILLLAFAVSFIITFASTPFVKQIAEKVDIVDKPDEARRVHKKPIPLLGGLAMFYGFIISVILFGPSDSNIRGMVLGALVILVVGIIDDARQLSAKVKLPFQILAAVILILHDVRIDVISVPGFISDSGVLHLGFWGIPLTLIWVVGVTNAVNLIDGLDGLAAGVSSISCMSLLCISLIVGEYEVALITAALTGACFGFLPYNFNPAKIFMGDTGSTFLGFILASVSIMGLFKSYAVISVAVPFLVLGLPLFDTGFAILRRMKAGKPIMSPDREHLHHRVLDMGFSQKKTVSIIYLMCTVLGLCAVVMVSNGILQALLLILCVIAAVLLASRLIGLRMEKEGEKDEEETND